MTPFQESERMIAGTLQQFESVLNLQHWLQTAEGRTKEEEVMDEETLSEKMSQVVEKFGLNQYIIGVA